MSFPGLHSPDSTCKQLLPHISLLQTAADCLQSGHVVYLQHHSPPAPSGSSLTNPLASPIFAAACTATQHSLRHGMTVLRHDEWLLPYAHQSTHATPSRWDLRVREQGLKRCSATSQGTQCHHLDRRVWVEGQHGRSVYAEYQLALLLQQCLQGAFADNQWTCALSDPGVDVQASSKHCS